MSFTCVEHKRMKFNSVRVIKAGCDLCKPFRKNNSKTLHTGIYEHSSQRHLTQLMNFDTNDPCVDFWKEKKTQTNKPYKM